VPLAARGPRKPLTTAFPGWGVQVCGSGTEALAIALIDARTRSPAQAPEVILPAYSCPDLVAASVYAGVRPRLVDTARAGWGYDLDSLRKSLSSDCVAVVAVNLLGTGDQSHELSEIATGRGIALIQDSAQHLPRRLPAQWVADYIVLSFGRGKPLNLLQGGALLHRPERTDSVAALTQSVAAGPLQQPLFGRLAGAAFNVATHPSVYGLARRLMGGAIGITRYDPLETLRSAPPRQIVAVEHGLSSYESRPGYDMAIWSEALPAWESAGVTVLSCASETQSDGLRLRLAMLAPDGRTRDAIVAVLDAGGWGVSTMYGTSMDRLEGIPPEVAAQGPFPNATDLAQRLFTLPTHSFVTARTVRAVQSALTPLLSHQAGR
jgi:dTDP-4-amino-4,6-dideoxygalactose transaminase